MHCHEGIELLYITTGRGKAVIGDEVFEIKDNHLIIAPPGVMHQQINESDDLIKII